MNTRRPSPTRRQQSGAVAIEAALVLPLLLGIGLVGSDMQRIGIERAQLEQAAGTAAITLAAQTVLTEPGLQALTDVLTQGRPDSYQVTVMNVMQSGRVNWALLRGNGGNLCESLSDGLNYTGTLPEDPPTESDTPQTEVDPSTLSMVVVQVCRNTRDITLAGGLVLPGTVRAQALNRVVPLKITLDKILQAESEANGLAAPAS